MSVDTQQIVDTTDSMKGTEHKRYQNAQITPLIGSRPTAEATLVKTSTYRKAVVGSVRSLRKVGRRKTLKGEMMPCSLILVPAKVIQREKSNEIYFQTTIRTLKTAHARAE